MNRVDANLKVSLRPNAKCGTGVTRQTGLFRIMAEVLAGAGHDADGLVKGEGEGTGEGTG